MSSSTSSSIFRGFRSVLPLAAFLIPLPAVSSPADVPGSQRSLMNPDISLDGLFSAAHFNRQNPVAFDSGHDPRQNGFNFQAVELTLGASVDPYFRGDVNLVFLPEGVEVEEAYATTLDLPYNLQFKAGQFFTAFGRSNPTHPHSWDFANKPLVLGRFFGGDGLRNPGAQLSWLTPLPWFSEVLVSQQNGQGGTAVSFDPDGKGVGGKPRSITEGVSVVRWSNFVPVTERWLVNAGASYATGRNAAGGQGYETRTHIIGGDLYVKFRPLEGLSFWSLQVEALQRYYGQPNGESALRDWGAYAELNYRLPQPEDRWHLGVRADWVGEKAAPVVTASSPADEFGNVGDADAGRRYRLSPVVTFYPSEFSKIRLQYDFDRLASERLSQHAVFVQLEFLIGSHGAHKF